MARNMTRPGEEPEYKEMAPNMIKVIKYLDTCNHINYIVLM